MREFGVVMPAPASFNILNRAIEKIASSTR